MLRIEQLKLNLNEPTSKIPEKIAKQLGISPPEKWKIIRESIDARDKSHLHFIYTVDFEATNEKVVLKKALRRKNIKIRAVDIKPYELPYSCYKENANNVSENDRPVIVGFGPCGMFAALILAQAGMRPVVFERGRRIEERIADVERFWNTGILDPESNVQFGEGGAGTFSDGKLTTGIKDSRIAKVNSEFIKAGADESIAYVNMPHIGTDVLRKVVINIRKKIIALGGEVRFESKLTGLNIEKDKIYNIMINDSEKIGRAHV